MRGYGIKEKDWYGLSIVMAMALMLLVISAGSVLAEEWNKIFGGAPGATR